jgi:hypothetical protein
LEGTDNITGKIADVKAAMDELRDAGDGGPQAVDVGLLQEGVESAGELSGQLEGVRNKALAVAAVGAGGIALSKSFQAVYEEGAGVESRLESILKAQNRLNDLEAHNATIQDVTVKGHFADDDEIRNATVLLDSFSVSTSHMGELLEDAARQARTMGTDVGGVAEQLGKAYNTGQVASLKKSGVTLSDSDIEGLNAAYARSAAEGQAMFVDVVGAAIKNNSVALGDSLTESQAKANDAARAIDDLQTNIGEGASNAQQNVDGLKNSLISMVAVNPELAKGAGEILTYGSYAAAGIGSLVAFGAQLGQMYLGYQSLRAVKALDAIATQQGAAANLEGAAAATANAEANTALAATEERSAAAATSVGSATVTASTEAQAAIDREIVAYNELIATQERAAIAARAAGAAATGGAGVGAAGAAGAGAAGLGAATAGGAGVAGAAIAAAPTVSAIGAVIAAADTYGTAAAAARGASDREVRDQGNGSMLANMGLVQQLTGFGMGDAVASIRHMFGGGDHEITGGAAAIIPTANDTSVAAITTTAATTAAKTAAAVNQTKGSAPMGGGFDVVALMNVARQQNMAVGNPISAALSMLGGSGNMPRGPFDGATGGTSINLGRIEAHARVAGTTVKGEIILSVDPIPLPGQLSAMRGRKRT